jgi:hypothetical protein
VGIAATNTKPVMNVPASAADGDARQDHTDDGRERLE